MKSNYQIKNIAFFAPNRQNSTYNNSYTYQNHTEMQAPLHPMDCRGEIVCEKENITDEALLPGFEIPVQYPQNDTVHTPCMPLGD